MMLSRMPVPLTRRRLLQSAIAAGNALRASAPSSTPAALALAGLLNSVHYAQLPASAIQHAKVILASTRASAAAGTTYGSARIVRDLAKEQGGKAEAMLWFDGA